MFSFSKKEKRYTIYDSEHAQFLIKAANINAITLYTSLQKKYPQIDIIAKNNLLNFWDDTLTIIGVAFAFAEIADTVPRKLQRGLCNALEDELDAWKPGSIKYVYIVLDTVTALMNSGLDMFSAVGKTFLGILDEKSKDIKGISKLSQWDILAKDIGTNIANSFHNWWYNN